MGFFSKKSFVLKTIHVTSSYRKNKRFCEKAYERQFLALFAVPSIPVKKRFREKV
jgi:hypothetical protein